MRRWKWYQKVAFVLLCAVILRWMWPVLSTDPLNGQKWRQLLDTGEGDPGEQYHYGLFFGW